MSELKRIRRKQILREAEGYLDLVMALGDQYPLTPAIRDRVAQRSLNALDRLGRHHARRSHELYLRGQAFQLMERYPDAIESLEDAAAAEPENIHVWLALGWCHKRNNRLDLAIQSLEEALSVDSSEAIIHYNLACYWSLAENVKLSLSYLANAFDIDPNYRDLVADERDFDPIRSDPDFQALTAVIV